MEYFASDSENNSKKYTIVITLDSGKILGKLCRIFIDINSKKVSAISFRKIFSSEELFLRMDRINRIGEDVIFIENELIPEHLEKVGGLPGEDLKEFQGTWIYTMSGEAIGALTDIGFLPMNWTINKIILNGNRAIDVDANNIIINHDKIEISDASLKTLGASTESEGLLAGLFGTAAIRQASILLQRTLRGIPVSQPPSSGNV